MVFVYGTLLKNESNSHLLAGAECIDSNCFIYGELYDTSLGYPTVCVDETSHTVWGELYEVTDEVLHKIDALEGYIGDELKNDYNRLLLNIYRKNGVSQALVYVFPSIKTAHLSLIESGNWRER
ncbi:gamma-glutamylcyclotransferase family protein [Alkalicoccobacillus plakortidis]|uniref:Gamma-glutamylcyclotransferase family protein n=1 Tax=Alkalicoccobacillus plakortidis TaxID=444060 RepID=A0ABT0XF65_9BACI|nr:gamma-glutamylcyclotransferase family protein [Alkalicoccobacillus plakortidis]MCM2674541.1 gamma-glutamylcyclotransferase [Alkalicoccobacillus plakortidis]